MLPSFYNQSPPPPYSMNMMQQQQRPSGDATAGEGNISVGSYPHYYAKGGHAKKGRMVIAHVNPQELHIMDHLQGKTERDHKTGLRSYGPLEEVFKNPHILAAVHSFVRKKKAMGGMIGHSSPHHGGPHHDYHNAHLNHLARGGTHGDSELALIGPHTHAIFNQLADGSTRNPHTGHPQYFSLRNPLAGLWDRLKGGAASAGESLGNAGRAIQGGAARAGSAIAENAPWIWNDYVKPAIPTLAEIGKAVAPVALAPLQEEMDERGYGGMAKALPLLAHGGLNYLSGPTEKNPIGKTVGQGLAGGLTSYGMGGDMQHIMGAGMHAAGKSLPKNSVVGSTLAGAGDSMLNADNGMGDFARAGAKGFDQAGGVKMAANRMMNKINPRSSGPIDSEPEMIDYDRELLDEMPFAHSDF